MMMRDDDDGDDDDEGSGGREGWCEVLRCEFLRGRCGEKTRTPLWMWGKIVICDNEFDHYLKYLGRNSMIGITS